MVIDYGGAIEEKAVVLEDAFDFQGTTLDVRMDFGGIYAIVDTAELAEGDQWKRKARFGGRQAARRARELVNVGKVGMLGMAYQALSEVNMPSLLGTVRSENSPPTVYDGWSHQLARNDGGTLHLGVSLTTAGVPMASVTRVTAEKYYSIVWTDVLVDGVSIGLPPSVYRTQESIVDSGTPSVMVPQTVFDALRESMLALCSPARNLTGLCPGTVARSNETLFDGVCFPLSAAEKLLFPDVAIQLASVDGQPSAPVVYDASAYLLHQYYCDTDGEAGFGFGVDNAWLTLGLQGMLGRTTVYDRAAGLVGFSAYTATGPALSIPVK